MNEYNANSPSEMLHLLIDGELDSSMETSLYASLMESEELRNEMRELISLKESVRRDVEAFTPPVSATKAIFTKLGYTVPLQPVVTSVPTSIGVWSKLANMLWNPAVTAVVASAITFILMWNFNSADNQNLNTLTTKTSTSEKSVFAQNTNINEDKNSDNNVATESAERIVYITKYIEKENNISNNDEIVNTVTEENNSSENNDNYLDALSLLDFNSLNNIRLEPLTSSIRINNEKEFTLINNYFPEAQREPALTLQFKVTSGTSYPNINLGETTNKMVDNFSIAAFAPVSKNIHIGLEAGKEPFGMEFYDIDDIDNRLYTIKQNPTLLWAGVGIKLNWDKHIEYLAFSQPYVHFTLASTSVGPLVKTNAGLQFVSQSGLGILLGLEGSLLAYQNDNLWYTSKNLGVMYGMFMRF